MPFLTPSRAQLPAEPAGDLVGVGVGCELVLYAAQFKAEAHRLWLPEQFSTSECQKLHGCCTASKSGSERGRLGMVRKPVAHGHKTGGEV